MYFRMKLPEKRIPSKKLEENDFHFDENRYYFEPTPPQKILPKNSIFVNSAKSGV